ncbi:FMN-binding protein [uncultured Lutibacter sp.]|uniref:FMN-binding protein n=1 Tax=uncultured Lutibacter sp. TaxID=437739 RepID=UPI002638CE4D|nr:FMN-binding protein [uncultured Lutibacter sp.]
MKRILIITLLFFVVTGFSSLNRVDKLIEKEIKQVFEIESFLKEVVEIPSQLNATLPIKITDSNFYKLSLKENLLGYYYFGQAYGKADYFDFIVIFDKDLIVSKVKIVTYREEHGGEVGSKRWLKQFLGKNIDQELKYQKDIAAISGATISARSMTNEVNKLLKTVQILNLNQLL